MMLWNIALQHQWSIVGKRYMQIYWKVHSITGIFQRTWPQFQNSDIDKYISMTTSEDNIYTYYTYFTLFTVT